MELKKVEEIYAYTNMVNRAAAIALTKFNYAQEDVKKRFKAKQLLDLFLF